MATQPPEGQVATQPLPSGTPDYQILMMNSDQPITIDLNLQTRSRQYNKPPATSAPKPPSLGSTEPLSTTNGPLQIPKPKAEVHTKILKGPLCQNVSSCKAAHSYSILDDLAQSPTSKKESKGNQNQYAPGNPRPSPQGNTPNTTNQQQGTQPKQDRPVGTNKPCSCCDVYGKYTHYCALLPHMKQM